ncbi:hypothetical protein [Iningainema tapete]|uniref:Uncharacterized protein n=1 Tax=Iningainema tapete BLCC-T55 TaxID=2748662 RepID=A0A8J7C8R3_9CYAN|nr:hypothetical protein [Iningainema tapete]MBD2775006.1 hypothetical protein [Iningainema tapete BLCC-T55]
MNENQQILEQDDDDVVINRLDAIDLSTVQYDDTERQETKNEIYKVFVGGLIGATLGGIAGALLIKGTAEKINQTVKNVGDKVKGASENFSQTVKGVGDAVQTVANGVNETVKDVGNTVNNTATDVNETVKSTADTVKGSANGMSTTVKNTVDTVKSAVTDVRQSVTSTAKSGATEVSPEHQIIKLPNNQAYMLVPVDNHKK